MRIKSFLCLCSISAAMLSGCSMSERGDIIDFSSQELDFVQQTRSETTSDQGSILLIGSTSIRYSGDAASEYRNLIKENESEILSMGNVSIEDSDDEILVRMYMPLRHATISSKGHTYTADENGYLTKGLKLDLSSIELIGQGEGEKTKSTTFKRPVLPSKVSLNTNAVIFALGDVEDMK